MIEIAIHCIQHSQAMLERGACELAHSFFHLDCLNFGLAITIARMSGIFYVQF